MIADGNFRVRSGREGYDDCGRSWDFGGFGRPMWMKRIVLSREIGLTRRSSKYCGSGCGG